MAIFFYLPISSLPAGTLLAFFFRSLKPKFEEKTMKKVSDIMTKDPTYCIPSSSLVRVAQLMVERDCGEVPVVKGEDNLIPVGVITDRDICCRSVALGLNPLAMRAQDSMS